MNRSSLHAWLTPAPDSVVAGRQQQGKPLWIDAVHLLWSVWVFITPIFGGGFDLRWLGLTLLSYPLFLLLYAATLLKPRRDVRWYALGMVVMSMALLPVYASGFSYFIFGCVMLGAGRARFSHYLLQLLLLNAVFIGWMMFVGDYSWHLMAYLPAITFIIGIIVSVDRIGQDKDAALRLSHDEVRRLAATAERERIGRDLHDLLGHTLSLITLKLELARKLESRDRPAARRELDDAERVAREALAQVRSAVTGIRAADLAAELASARLLLESSCVRFEHDPAPQALSPEVERGVALLLREAATNIARHARASSARVAFAHQPGQLQVTIADDGRGGVSTEGNGIAGMRDRVRALGGTLSIDAPRGRGTRIVVQLPLQVVRAMPVPPSVADAQGEATAYAAATTATQA